MKPSHTNPESTRLEDLRISNAGISLNVQGQSVWIKNDSDSASIQALRSLYDVALKCSIKQTHEKNLNSWYKKLSTWIGGFFDKQKSEGFELSTDSTENTEKKLKAKASDKNTKVVHPVLHADPSEIHMKAIYADKDGIHISWSKSEPGKTDLIEETLHPLDSELASVLNNCYTHLGRLGYTVIGIDMKPAVTTSKNKDVETKLSTEDTTKPVTPKPMPIITDHQTLKTIVVRPHPMRPEDPNRLYISPVDNQENTLAITISERLLKSIRESTHSDINLEERVTLLRCSPYKGTYKVIAIGEGLDEKQNALKWTEASRWNESKVKPEKSPPEINPIKIRKSLEPELF
jgi:hypothetical protein